MPIETLAYASIDSVIHNKREHLSMFSHPLKGLWAFTDSNRRPSACKADALNQLS